MAPPSTLRDEPLDPAAAHLCIDVQRLFLPGTDWGLEWMPRVLPQVVALCEPAPEATVFTRFVPARRPGEGRGVWARYWTRWASMTLEATGPEMVGLVPELARFVPPVTRTDRQPRAADLGYRTILVSDAVCSTSDDAHDAMLALFSERYGQHVEIGLTEEVRDLWPPRRDR